MPQTKSRRKKSPKRSERSALRDYWLPIPIPHQLIPSRFQRTQRFVTGVPTHNSRLFRWCLADGLRVMQHRRC